MRVQIFSNRAALGHAAALEIAGFLRAQPHPISMVFAAAPSQTETLNALAAQVGIAWNRIHAFHLDEYAGASADSPHSFRKYLLDTLFSKVQPASFEGLRGEAPDLLAECERYAALWNSNPPLAGLIGIGENCHIAFNDPPHSRFDDPETVRLVQLTHECRAQQVNDGAFPSLEAVPHAALTVSIPAIQRIPALFVMVPGVRKAQAVKAALEGPLAEECPASILRTHPNATLFLDRDSASLLA